MIGLVAVGLVAIFIAEAANAATVRRRNTVENEHTCNKFLDDGVTLDKCFGADSVADRLYGWDEVNEIAICKMTGTVVCVSDIKTCTGTTNEARLDTSAFFAIGEFVSVTEGEDTSFIARDLTVLPFDLGQEACIEAFPDDPSTFDRFWPRKAVAYSVYTDDDLVDPFPNISGTDNVFELIELCDVEEPDILYNCAPLWDSTSGAPMPKLPCCGESNTLTVQSPGGGTVTGGTVTSDDSGITCGTLGTDCVEVYDGTEAPIDACPEVKLAAEADPGYEFVGWIVDPAESKVNCPNLDGDCVVKPDANVTAEFTIPAGIITFVVEPGNATDAKIWLKKPHKKPFTNPEVIYCRDICTIDTNVDPNFTGVSEIIAKRAGGDYISWEGTVDNCTTGENNSLTTCVIPITGDGQIIKAIWE
jgi:hypothetical protein